jgi:hypothetical protein
LQRSSNNGSGQRADARCRACRAHGCGSACDFNTQRLGGSLIVLGLGTDLRSAAFVCRTGPSKHPTLLAGPRRHWQRPRARGLCFWTPGKDDDPFGS